MDKKILLAVFLLLLPGGILFAKNKGKDKEGSIVDFNLQVGANTTLSSVTDYAQNMEKLAEGISALKDAKEDNKISAVKTDIDKTIKGYNGAAQALSVTMANLRFGASFQLGLKPLRKKSVELALGLGSGLRMGGLQNVVDAAQGHIVFFDVPIHAYIGLKLVDILRFDGIVGVIFSASSQELSSFTAKSPGTAAKTQLISDAFNAPKLDLVLRASVSMFYLELNGNINLQQPEKLSFFRLGLGVNIAVL